MRKDVVPRLPPFICFPSKAVWMGMWGELKKPTWAVRCPSLYLWVTPQTDKAFPLFWETTKNLTIKTGLSWTDMYHACF